MAGKVKLSVPVQRMLQVIEILRANGDIQLRQEFYDTIGIARQTIYNIRQGTQYFTVDHIQKACKQYNINSNWILGLSDEVFREQAAIHFISEGAKKATEKKTTTKLAAKKKRG